MESQRNDTNIFIDENVRDALADHFESLYSYYEPLEKVYVLISLAQLLLSLTEASNFSRIQMSCGISSSTPFTTTVLNE